jgi:transposase
MEFRFKRRFPIFSTAFSSAATDASAAGSDRGGERAVAMFTLIETAKLKNVDPQAWLADVLRRINDHPAAKLNQLLPWHWKEAQAHPAAA